MRLLFRADASLHNGVGHVMRSLTLAKEFSARGHRVVFATNDSHISWLENELEASGLELLRVAQATLPTSNEFLSRFDMVVIDSYDFSSTDRERLRRSLAVLAIVDGVDGAGGADIFLDHNLGAETRVQRVVDGSMVLAGGRFALIRDEVAANFRQEPWKTANTPAHVTIFFGGTDPGGLANTLIRRLTEVDLPMRVDVFTDSRSARAGFGGGEVKVKIKRHKPGRDLPRVLGRSHLVITASGSSAWEVAALGLPMILVCVSPDQRPSFEAITSKGMAIGLNAEHMDSKEFFGELIQQIRSLLGSEALRVQLSAACRDNIDFRGKTRVVEAVEEWFDAKSRTAN